MASTGTVFNLKVNSATTNSGGNWLAVTGCGSYCSTPHALTVTVAPDVSLAAGVYTGQIVFAELYNTFSMTVPVTLTVAPSGGTFFDNLPGQMSFSLKTSGAAPPSQGIQIRNGGSGTLNWTLAATTSDGGNWLSASALSGPAPAMVSFTITPSHLPGGGVTAGSFVGQLLFQSAGGNVTVPVSVVVGPAVFVQVNAISFAKPYAGADPLPQTLTVASTGIAFNFTAAAHTATGGSWLTVSGCGSYCSTPHAITATANPDAALAAGTYTGEVVFTELYGSMAITVPVTLTIAQNTSFFDNMPGQMSFSMKTSGAAPPGQTVEIRNGGSGTLSWTLTTSTADGGNWLSASMLSGIAPSLVTISITPPNLPGGGVVAGTFVGELVFQTGSGAVTVQVSVNVGDNVFRQVNAINFTKAYGGADPLPQALTVASTGTAFNFTVAASTAAGGSWLTASGCGSYCSTPQEITAAVSADPSLAPGTYTGQIVFRELYGSMAITVPVTLTVAPFPATGPFFDSLPGQMSFSMKKGGSAPPSQTLEIRNAGTGGLNWTLTTSTADGGNWLSASAPSGTAPSLVNIAVDPQNLPGAGLIAGTFVGELVFRTAGSSVSVSVSFNVGDNVFRQVNAISFTKPYGGFDPLPQVLMIASTGTAFNFTVAASTSTGGSWLTVAGCGSYCPTPSAITVGVKANAALAAGTYTGQVIFRELYGSMSITVPVTLTVGQTNSAPLFDNLPGQVTFSFQPSSANPPSQTIQVRNAGSGSLNWMLGVSTSDGGNWLTASPPSGGTPAPVTVGVITSALPGSGLTAGTFTGELVFRAPGESITVPVSVIVGTSVYTQLGALNFTKQYGGSNPVPQTLTVSSTSVAFNFKTAASTGNGGSWFNVTGCGSYCATPTVTTATVNANAGLAPGIYTGQIVFTELYNSMAMTVPITLTVTGTSSISATSGTPQSARINTVFANPLVATVTMNGNPVSGVTVTFTSPGSGASGTFAGGVNTALTNAQGQAVSPVFTANGTAGSYTVTASAPGASQTAGFSLTNTPPIGQFTGSVLRDFAGNGRWGAVIYDPVLGQEYTALSNGNGTYSYVGNPFTPAFDILRSGDFNGDGKADLVVYNSHNGSAYIGMGNGDGTFNFQSLFWSPGYNFVEPGDLNGDGKTDFALYNSSTGTMYTAISNGAGLFAYKYTLISNNFTFVRLADFNGDGKADILLYRASDGLAYLGIGDGTGSFSFTGLFISAGYNLGDIGDLNGDGKADVILYNAANGNAATGISNGTGGFSFTPMLFSPGFTSVRLADYTGDGKADATVYNRTNAAAYFGTGTGTGTFNFVSLFWSAGYDWVEPQDVNGDGKIDVILYNSATGTQYTGISNADGTFAYTYSLWGPGKMLAR